MQTTSTKFKVGDLVKWNSGVAGHNDNQRIDRITEVVTDIYGDTRYRTIETNMPNGDTPKQGIAYESYLTGATQ